MSIGLKGDVCCFSFFFLFLMAKKLRSAAYLLGRKLHRLFTKAALRLMLTSHTPPRQMTTLPSSGSEGSILYFLFIFRPLPLCIYINIQISNH